MDILFSTACALWCPDLKFTSNIGIGGMVTGTIKPARKQLVSFHRNHSDDIDNNWLICSLSRRVPFVARKDWLYNVNLTVASKLFMVKKFANEWCLRFDGHNYPWRSDFAVPCAARTNYIFEFREQNGTTFFHQFCPAHSSPSQVSVGIIIVVMNHDCL